MPQLLEAVGAALSGLPGGSAGTTRFLVAVSGGADSTAMLAAVAGLPGMAGRLAAAHVNHGLRPLDECTADCRAVQRLCERVNVPFAELAVPRGAITRQAEAEGSGIEAAARRFRYEALAREAERVRTDYILVAHTKDDALETVLMRMLRGAGPRGLALMRPLVPAPFGGPPVCRPLLESTRHDVLDFLAEQGLSYRTDSTNADPRFLRNRLRLRLIPVLDEHFPSWRRGLLDTAETQAIVSAYLDDELEKHGAARLAAGEPAAVIKNFEDLPPLLREEALFDAAGLVKPGGKTLRRCAVRGAIRAAASQTPPLSADLGAGLRVSREGGSAVVRQTGDADAAPFFSLLINKCGTYTIGGMLVSVSESDAGFVFSVRGGST